MKPFARTFLVIVAYPAIAALLFLLPACVTAVPRERAEPVPTAAPTAVPTPIPTAIPRPTSTPAPTPTPIIEGLLDVRGPEDKAAVRADSVVVHGYARPDAVVHVNEERVELDETGRFRDLVDLSPGYNTIVVDAETPEGATESITVSVISLLLPPQPFFLIIEQPEDQSSVVHATIPLLGRTTAGTVVTVNGVAVPVDISGVFSTTIALEPGPNLIEVQGTSSGGEQLSALVAVIYREVPAALPSPPPLPSQ